MNVLKEIIKIIPDFKEYYLEWELNEMNDSDLIYELEHEIDLYKNWKIEGFRDNNISYINKYNIRKINGLLKRYYNIEKVGR